MTGQTQHQQLLMIISDSRQLFFLSFFTLYTEFAVYVQRTSYMHRGSFVCVKH